MNGSTAQQSGSSAEEGSRTEVAKRRPASGITLRRASLVFVSVVSMVILMCVGEFPACFRNKCEHQGVLKIMSSYDDGQVVMDDRPYYDLVVAILVVGGDSPEAQAEIARARRVYDRYGNKVVPEGGNSKPLSLKYVFVVGKGELDEVPETGLLLGDFFHVNVREGYTHLSDKTKAMTALSAHLR